MKTSDLDYMLLGDADLESVAVLEAEAFPTPWTAEQYRAVLAQGHCKLFGVKKDGALVGYIAIAVHDAAGEAEVYNIAVKESFRKQGIGKKLLGVALQAACINMLERVILEVRVSNTAALALYHSLGFVQAGVRPRYYPDTGEDALVLIRECRQ